MKTISVFFSVLLFTTVTFSAPQNGVIDVAKTSIVGDSVILLTPIDFGQLLTSDSKWRVTANGQWFSWIVFDKNNNKVVEPGTDASILVSSTVTADGNHVRTAFVPPAGYKGHIMWSSYQLSGGTKVPIWVNTGYNNQPGIPRDQSSYTDGRGFSAYHAYL